ncbi:MAG: serine hydrolase domain-containing protein [Actinomycetota bacterium]
MAGLSDAFDLIGEAIEHRLPVTHTPGVALAITDGHEILGVVVRGFADVASGAAVRPETRFQIGSISKGFAGMIAVAEAEAGRLDLHQPVTEILPWLEIAQPFGPITMHDLMTHSSGLHTGTEDAPTGLGAAWQLRDTPPTFAPGERFWYSNDGWKVAGLVLEQLTGRPIHDLLRERLFGPLHMTSTQGAILDDTRLNLATGYLPLYSDRPARLDHPLVQANWIVSNTADGSIVSNVLDMTAYARLLLGGGRIPGDEQQPVLSADGFGLLTGPHVDDPETPGFGYGYGFWVGEDRGIRSIWHSGGMVGFEAYLEVRPEHGLGCVILQNGMGSKNDLARYALDVVHDAIRGSALTALPHPPASTDVPNGKDFAGTFTAEDGRWFEVVVEGPSLRYREGPLGVLVERDPLGEVADTFLLPHPSLDRYALRFGRDDSGAVVEAFHGSHWFRGPAWSGPEPAAHPKEWEAYPGLYRNDDPWSPVMIVSLRKAVLTLEWPSYVEDGAAQLIPLEDGSFAVGEMWMPKRIRFERMVQGQTAMAVFNAGRWHRSFEDQ